MEATDQQMQNYADVRLRRRAEEFRALVAGMRDDKAAIDSVYARSVGASPWADARTDGPPKLLSQQDMLVYNAFFSNLLDIVDGVGGVEAGTAGEQKIFQLHANLAVFQSSCVRPIEA